MKNLLLTIMASLVLGCQLETQNPPSTIQEEVPSKLPLTPLTLDDLSAFEPVGTNWLVVGSVLSDHTQEKHLLTEAGTGILVNQNDENNRDNLHTNWEHGDLELKVEVMVPKGSNSGIYLQGRYEVQLRDSWQKENPGFGDCGGIYQRWDETRPDGEKGFEGHPPLQNAAKAPGLWQQFHIFFRAPRFDEAGNKTENARFEKVILNGVIIQENVEVTGPTRAASFRDEALTGPLMIQGDHGPVALRNIRYKRYFDEAPLAINNIQYQYFEIDGPITALPNFDSLTVVREGTTDSLVYQTLSERDQRVAYIFTGQLEVAKSGEYLFTVYSDDGSQLFIRDKMLIDNDGKHDYEPKSGLIALDQGTHNFKLTYFNNNWGQGLTVFYEGPELRQQPLVSRLMESKNQEKTFIVVQPEDGPEMVRSFVMHQNRKLTHTISVGDPTGLHYSVDLRRGGLLQFWRGNFADVTEMWHHRGIPQLLQPREMAVAAESGLLAAMLEDPQATYPTDHQDVLVFKSYRINQNQQPVFTYRVGEALVTDFYQPDANKGEIVRTIRTDKGIDNLYTRIAAGDYIKPVGNGYFSVGGNYYIRLIGSSTEPIIRQQDGQEEMLFALSDATKGVTYAMLW